MIVTLHNSQQQIRKFPRESLAHKQNNDGISLGKKELMFEIITINHSCHKKLGYIRIIEYMVQEKRTYSRDKIVINELTRQVIKVTVRTNEEHQCLYFA